MGSNNALPSRNNGAGSTASVVGNIEANDAKLRRPVCGFTLA